MWKATIYGQSIEANTITGLKRKASKIANVFNNSVDKMTVETNIGPAIFHRFNKKTPWGTITYGRWD